MRMTRVLASQNEDFPRWYQDVILKAQLAETGPVRGTMVIRPWGYAIWERLQGAIDERIKATGARNAYFPS
jgi:prolyl-tRNA synthetase